MLYRDTTTGLKFEERVKINHEGAVNLQKYNLYRYLEQKGIKWDSIISKKLLPDEAFFDENTKEFIIYEKKYQETHGSADEKPQTCGFKIQQFRKIGKALGAEKVSYTYIFNDWFHRPEYADMLEYIKSVDGCDYIFEEDINE